MGLRTKATRWSKLFIMLAVASAMLWQLPSCGGGGSPSEPAPVTTTTTTTTTTSTTTTTTTTTTSTTTTTTTTLPSVSYANVHPIWSAQGCTGCHGSGNRLDLSGSAASVCATIRNGTDRSGGQYLDNPGCSVNGSSIIGVPATGLRPDGTGHPGGTNQCFGSGASCRQTILAWCTAGAAC